MQIQASQYKFCQLLESLNCPPKKAAILWEEIYSYYNSPKRHYHNLNHLESMFNEMETHRGMIEDPEIMAVSIWYHDLIYDVKRKDNELLSAERAKSVLTELGITNEKIDKCYSQIIATKSHESSNQDKDLNWLMDIDLEVLGRDWESYKLYTQQIRAEYKIFPWFMYKKGRKKAMQSFLQRERIYHTSHYYSKLESKARTNIEREIKELLK
ncbi:MAG: hypothetical protein AAF502_15225 [Bacteroidota bacterium]